MRDGDAAWKWFVINGLGGLKYICYCCDSVFRIGADMGVGAVVVAVVGVVLGMRDDCGRGDGGGGSWFQGDRRPAAAGLAARRGVRSWRRTGRAVHFSIAGQRQAV